MTCVKLLLCLIIITTFSAGRGDAMPAVASSSAEFVSTPLTSKNYKQILRNNQYVFVKFFTDWCAFSKKIIKIWENVGEHFEASEDILIAEIDCGKYKPVCQKFNVREYPTLLIFKEGKRFERYIGPRTTNDLVAFTEKFITKRKIKDKMLSAKAQESQTQAAQ